MQAQTSVAVIRPIHTVSLQGCFGFSPSRWLSSKRKQFRMKPQKSHVVTASAEVTTSHFMLLDHKTWLSWGHHSLWKLNHSFFVPSFFYNPTLKRFYCLFQGNQDRSPNTSITPRWPWAASTHQTWTSSFIILLYHAPPSHLLQSKGFQATLFNFHFSAKRPWSKDW